MIASVQPALTALTLLRHSSAPASVGRPDPGLDILLSSSMETGRSRTDAEASAALFSVTQPNPEKEMAATLKRVGEVFGIERDGYATQSSFMAAVGEAFTKLTADPGDPARIDEIAKRLDLDAETVMALKEQKTPDMLVGVIEKALGLDRLGVSLDTMIEAGRDPDSAEADAVRARLLDRAAGTSDPITRDELGLYRPRAPIDRAVA